MFLQTPKKRVLFVHSLRLALLAFFGVFCLVISLVHSPKLAEAATNNTVNFQARLQSAAGAIVPDGNYNIEFKLYSASSGGSALWTEDYYNNASNGLKTTNGYITANLGSITAFSGINWDQPLWLTMNVGGTTTGTPSLDGEMSPRLTLTAVPYAFRAGQLATSDAGSTLTSTLSIQAPTGGNQTFVIQDQGAGGTYNLLTSTSGVQLQTSTPGAAQAGNLNISGTGIFGTGLLAPGFDRNSAGTLTIGGSIATALSIGNTTSNIATTINGTTVFKPTSGNDSTTAVQIQNAAGTSFFTADSTTQIITTKDLNIGANAGSRLFSDDFESGNTGLWTGTNLGPATIDTTNPRNGKYALKITSSSAKAYLRQTIIGQSTVYARANVKATSATTGFDLMGIISISAGNYVTVSRSSTGYLCEYDSWVSTNYCSTVQQLPLNQWHMVEIRVTKGSPGTLQLSYDGAIISDMNRSVNTGTTNFDTIDLGDWNTADTAVFYADDFSVDTTSTGSSSSQTVQDSLHVGGTSSFGSSSLFQSASNATNSFQIQNSAGTSNLFIADTVNSRIGINSATPAYPLDVTGDINSSTAIRVGGTTVCTSLGCTVSSTSGVQLQGSTPGTAQTGNLNISGTGIFGGVQSPSLDTVSAGALTIGGTNATSVNVGGTTTAGINFKIAGSTVASLSGSGAALFQSSAANGFVVQDASSTNLFSINTSANSIAVGNGTSTVTFANSGANSSWTTNGVNLPIAIRGQSNVVANGYIYNIGGFASGADQSTVSYAKLNAGGSVGSWTTSSNPLPGILAYASVVTNNGYVYVIGGTNGSIVSTVYYAKLNTDGTTSAWTTSANSLPVTRGFGNASVVNGYVYFVGGFNGSYLATTTYAKLNADGSVGTWTTSGVSLPNGISSAALVSMNGYMYLAGGYSGSTNQTAVYSNKLNADGSLSSWTTSANPLPAARTDFESVLSNGYLYVMGGDVGGVYQSTIYYTKLNSDGSNSSWTTSANPLPDARQDGSAATANGYVYVLGGRNSSASQSTIYYDTLQMNNILGTSIFSGNVAGQDAVNTNEFTTLGQVNNLVSSIVSNTSSNFIQLQGSTPGTAQTGNINVTGTIIGGTALLAPSFDTASAGTLAIGGTNATSITVGGTSQSGTTTIGQSTATNIINVGNANLTANIQTINIGTGASSSGADSVTVGSTNGASATTIQAGTGNLNLVTNNASAGTIIKTSTNSKKAFQIQNSTGTAIFLVDTVTTTNLVTNPGFEANTTGWALSGSATIAQNSTIANTYHGQASLLVTTSATGAGASVSGFSSTITPAQYNFSFYALGGTNTGALGVTIAGGSAPSCTLNSTSISTTGFQRYNCTFTSTTSNVTAITITTTGGTSGTFWVDGVQLVAGAVATPYAAEGAIQLRGSVNSPVTFQNSSNSTSSFQIQNVAGTSNLFVADTLNNRVGIGTAAPAYMLDVGGDINSSTAVRAPLFDTATGVGLSIGTGTATSITLGKAGVGATFNGSLTLATGSTFTNASSTLNTAIAITDKSSGGAIGTAATTVDVATTFTINQTTASQTLTIPSPTVTTAGRVIYVSDIGSASFTIGSVVFSTGSTAQYVWNGSSWSTGSIDTGVTLMGTLDSQTASANGAVISGNTLYLQSASATKIGLVSTGAQTLAGAKTFSGNAVFGSGVVKIQASGSDSANALQVLQNGGGAVFNVDANNTIVAVTGTFNSTGAATIKGGALNLNASSNFVTNIGTGTTNAAVSIGNSANTLAIGASTTTISGNALITSTTNSTKAFQVQNSLGAAIFLVDTATTTNLVTNPGFEVNTTGWALSGSATIAQNITRSNTYHGQASLLVTTSGSGAGATVSSFTAAITPAQYNFSFYALAGTNTGALGVTITGGSTPTCTLNSTSLSSSGFQRYNCTFTSTTSNVTAITIATTGGTSGTFWIDGVQLVAGSSATAYSASGAIQLRGTINSPVTFQNSSNSTTAFQIQNAAGTSNLFVADTLNGAINVNGTASFKSTSNSTTAFQIQNASSVSMFNVDTSTGTITLGSGGNTVSFTAAGGLVAAGTAQHAKQIVLTPEYAGAVLDAAGDAGGAVNCSTANAGTMTSGYSTVSHANYYNWSVAGATAQCYDVVVQVPMPSDWAAWNGSGTIVAYNSVGTDTTSVMVDAYDVNGTHDSGFTSGTYTGVTSNTSGITSSLPTFSGTYANGGSLLLRVRMTSNSAKNVRIGTITLNYFSKY